MKTYKWKVLSNTRGEGNSLVDTLLKNRGIKTKKERDEFLNPKLELVSFKSVGIDGAQVKKSLARIKKAIDNNEKIIVFGDYDVDGICGTAILWETIYETYKNVEPYIPSRMDEGYGLSEKGIENLLSKHEKIGLIITVDNGIVADKAVDFANKKGIDVIITDHHVSSKSTPKAFSIVHTTKLCGTGVAYLLSQAIRKPDDGPVDKHLELVALATVADLVPLIGSNRTLLKFGLEKLKRTNRLGLIELFSESKIKPQEIDTYHIGHIIAPRLNASGRITHAMDSLRLICTKDPIRAKTLAAGLGEVNRVRQNFTFDSAAHADVAVDVSQKLIFVSHESYEEGVIGLVASRLVEKYYKPAIAVSVGKEISKGSARSVAGFNIIEFLRMFEAHMVNAGGHPMAAGFTIETVKLDEFKNALVESASKLVLDEYLERVLKIDQGIEFNELSIEFFNQIIKLAPFGMANLEPVFVTKKVRVKKIRSVGKENKHIKLLLSKDENEVDAIFFNGAEFNLSEGQEIDIAYTLENNSWNGNERLQLKVRDAFLREL